VEAHFIIHEGKEGVVMSNRTRSIRRTQPVSHESTARQVVCDIRILAVEEELIESYRLRHEVYGALGYLRGSNPSGLEIDEFDGSSIPFGAFDPASGVMIGTLRLVTTEPQPRYDGLIRCILASLDDAVLAEQALGSRRRALPSMISDDVERQIAGFNTGRFVVGELSRTIVHPDFRGAGVSRGLMEVGLAHAARASPAVLVGSCLPDLVPMYARYGYSRLVAAGLDYFDSVGQYATAVVCRTDILPQPTGAHVDELLRSMRSGAMERTLEIGRGSRALYRFTTTRRTRRRTMEW
jgi:predicted GNAT family N-acyltransferase